MDTVTPAITVGREKNLPDGEFGHSSGRVKLTATTRLVRIVKKLKYVRIASAVVSPFAWEVAIERGNCKTSAAHPIKATAAI